MKPPAPEDPKGIAGLAKPQLQLVPPVINTAMAAALKIGADKYGPWNWRTNRVEIMTYLGAMRRHIDAVLEGEDLDPESGTHHLGHVAAGCAIVLDARAHGTLVDNRPPAHHPFGESARLPREVLDNCGLKMQQNARAIYHSKEGEATYEVILDPNSELAEFIEARREKRFRDGLCPSDRAIYDAAKETLNETAIKERMAKHEADMAKLHAITDKVVRDQATKKLMWGSMFESPLEKAFEESSKEHVEAIEREIEERKANPPTNLDALADHIDEVVNEFPTEPLDPHA
jgi:hypothetical protein